VELWAGTAFGHDSQAKLWTRLQASRFLALTAGAFPETTRPHRRRPMGKTSMPDDRAASPAVRGRRRARLQEWRTQTVVARMLKRCLPKGCFYTALENAPRNALAGMMAKQRGTRSGLPDWLIIWCGGVVCVELKSHAGIASPAQREIRDELLAAGVKHWWLCRTARAVLLALHCSGIPLRSYTPPDELDDWEGPFADPMCGCRSIRLCAASVRPRPDGTKSGGVPANPGCRQSARPPCRTVVRTGGDRPAAAAAGRGPAVPEKVSVPDIGLERIE